VLCELRWYFCTFADTESVTSSASDPLIAESLPRLDGGMDVEHTEYIIQTGQFQTHSYSLTSTQGSHASWDVVQFYSEFLRTSKVPQANLVHESRGN